MVQRPRGFETVGDMARSLGVTFLFIGFLLAVTHRDHGDGVRTVEWKPVVAQLPGPLLRPAGLPDGYRVTSARRLSAGKPGLHIGSLTPAGRYVALEESTRADSDYLQEVAGAVTPDGSQRVGGQLWSRWQRTDREGRVTRVLTRAAGAVTIVVHGTASWDELAQLITVARL